jgi:uncharacterized membrane protein YdjX (TVP38/TMEM64 family)
MNTIARALTAFGRFWWGFLVGDSPELFVAMLLIVGAALALHHHRWVAVVVLPSLVIAAVVLSAFRGRKRRR